MKSRAAANEAATTADEQVRQGAIDRYQVIRAMAGSSGCMLYEVASASEKRSMLLLEMTREVYRPAFDPTSTLQLSSEQEKAVVLTPRDQGTHEERTFMVYDVEVPLALCSGMLYGWDPLRLELIGRIVEVMRQARDARLHVVACAYETLVASPPRQVRFASPVLEVEAPAPKSEPETAVPGTSAPGGDAAPPSDGASASTSSAATGGTPVAAGTTSAVADGTSADAASASASPSPAQTASPPSAEPSQRSDGPTIIDAPVMAAPPELDTPKTNGPPKPAAINLERLYFAALQELLPKLVRGNFMPVPPLDDSLVEQAPIAAHPLMWSAQMHSSPEVRELLDDIVCGRIDSLDAAQQAIDSFGATAIVRKRTGWGTHRGLIREGNEDALMMLEQTMVAGSRPVRMEVYAVADGMGGHEAGEIASEITLKSMAVELISGLNLTTAREYGRDVLDHEFLAERMTRAIERTNQTVRQYAWDAHSKSRRKPGSTLVCSLSIGPVLTLGHVGDSRAYKIGQDGTVERITRDHSPVQKLVDHRKLTPEQAFFHPHRHQISSNIGISPDQLKQDVNIRYLREGEGVVICSDGLNDMLQDIEIEDLCKKEKDPRRLARLLVEAACDRGGHDNVTVVVVMRAPGPSQEQRETSPKVS